MGRLKRPPKKVQKESQQELLANYFSIVGISHPDIVATRAHRLGFATYETINSMTFEDFAVFIGKLSLSVENSEKLVKYWSLYRHLDEDSSVRSNLPKELKASLKQNKKLKDEKCGKKSAADIGLIAPSELRAASADLPFLSHNKSCCILLRNCYDVSFKRWSELLPNQQATQVPGIENRNNSNETVEKLEDKEHSIEKPLLSPSIANDVIVNLESFQIICEWGGEWFEVEVLSNVSSVLLVKRVSLLSLQNSFDPIQFMCPEVEWVLCESPRLLFRETPPSHFGDGFMDMEDGLDFDESFFEEGIDDKRMHVCEPVKEKTDNDEDETFIEEDDDDEKAVSVEQRENNEANSGDGTNEEEEEEEEEEAKGFGHKKSKRKRCATKVDVTDMYRFPLAWSTSRDTHKPLHLRRVQLWWAHCEEWFSGTLREKKNKRYLVDYDDGDEETVSESYLRTHRNVHLFPYVAIAEDPKVVKKTKKNHVPVTEVTTEEAPKEAAKPEHIACVAQEEGWEIIYFPKLKRFVPRILFKHAWIVLGHFFTQLQARASVVSLLQRLPHLAYCDRLVANEHTSILDTETKRLPTWLLVILTSTRDLDRTLNLITHNPVHLPHKPDMDIITPCKSTKITVEGMVNEVKTSEIDVSPRNKELRRRQQASLDLSRRLNHSDAPEPKKRKDDHFDPKVDPNGKKRKEDNFGVKGDPNKLPLAFPPDSYCSVKVDRSFAMALNELYNLVGLHLDGGVKEELLKLCLSLAEDVSSIYLLIAGEGAPLIKLGPHNAKNTSAVQSQVNLKQIRNAASRLRTVLGCEGTSTALWEPSVHDTGSVVTFAPNSRARRRYVNTGQTGGYNGFLLGSLKVIDAPPDVLPNLDVVGACMQGEVHEDDLRFATNVLVVKDEKSELFGEREVVANRSIRAGELGPYAGVLLRDDEVLQHLGQRPRPFLRALHFWYSVLFDGATCSSTEGEFGSVSSAVDTFSLFPFIGNEMSLVNDFAGPDRSEEHKKNAQQPNCKYQIVKSNGWPYVFVMATQDIAQGDALRADYGDAFWETWAAVEKFERSIDVVSRVLFESLDALVDRLEAAGPKPLPPPTS